MIGCTSLEEAEELQKWAFKNGFYWFEGKRFCSSIRDIFLGNEDHDEDDPFDDDEDRKIYIAFFEENKEPKRLFYEDYWIDRYRADKFMFNELSYESFCDIVGVPKESKSFLEL